MKNHKILYSLLCLLLSIFNSINAKEGPEVNEFIEYYKCNICKAFISNINISPTQQLYDDKGNPQYFIKRGSTELYIGHEKINPAAVDSKKTKELIKNHSKWKTAEKKSTDGVIVGLAQESTIMLIFSDKKWWILYINSDDIGIAEAEIILDKNGMKVVTLKMGVQPSVSDDPDIINAFSVIIRN